MAVQRIVIVEGRIRPFGLASAARRLSEVEALDGDLSEMSQNVDAVVVDAALEEREALLAAIAPAVDVPILAEMPVATSPEDVERLAETLEERRVHSINPLAYQLHTRRLLDLVRDEADPVTAIFAAWRFRPDDFEDGALPQLLDYIAGISTEPPLRIAAMRREAPEILVATIRYQDGVVAHIEFGAHLPPAFDATSELTVEVFRRESVLHSDAFGQALTVHGRGSRAINWAPDVAVAALQESLEAVAAGDAPPRGLREDHAVLTVVEAIEWAAEQGTVARL